MKKQIHFFSALFLLLFVSVSCQKQGSSQVALEEYVSYRFSNNQSKNGLLDWVTGNLYNQFVELSDDDFKKLLDSDRYKLKKFKILNSNCETKSSCYITYIISYETYNDKKKAFKTDVKKIAHLLMVEKAWKLADVSNIKTYHDSKDEIGI